MSLLLATPSLATLGLDRTLPKALDTFVTASLAIYDNTLGQPAVAAQLAKYGYPADRPTAERNQVQAFIDARRAQAAGAAPGARERRPCDPCHAAVGMRSSRGGLRQAG